MATLRSLCRFTRVASSSTGANAWHSWHFMYKRNDEMEEEVPAVRSVSLQLAKHNLFRAVGARVVERTLFVKFGNGSLE
jgi:hypothetical protein